MKKYTHIIEDGIYKISLNSIFDYIVQNNNYKTPKDYYNWLRHISDQVCAMNEVETTPEIEIHNDWMFGIKTDGDVLLQSAVIKDYYFAVPAMSYILFTWLQMARNENLYGETKRIWEILHELTYDSTLFFLPSTEPAIKS